MPHSEIPGSKPARGSPGLFAACHVLRRLSTPRHPPDALLSLAPPRRQHHRDGASHTHAAGTDHARRRDRHPPVSPASAGPEGIPEGRLARRHHTMGKGPGRRRRGAGRDRPAGEGRGAPKLADRRATRQGGTTPWGMVGPGRLERPTSRLSGVRSDRLSYGPAPGAPGRGVAAVSGKGRADGAAGL